MKTFGHSGDAGDVFYALPTIRAMGGGHLRLRPANGGVRESMTPAKATSLASLIRLQPYIASCEFGGGVGDVDLDRFRWGYNPTIPLAESAAKPWGVTPDLVTPWLMAPVRPISSVLIHRSPRYHNSTFPWGRIMAEYRNLATFVGQPAEHADFARRFGTLPYLPTSDFLSLAAAINGAALFIGNQSAPFAIAEGLKVPVIQETSTTSPNCIYPRPDAQYVMNGEVSLEPVFALVQRFNAKRTASPSNPLAPTG